MRIASHSKHALLQPFLAVILCLALAAGCATRSGKKAPRTGDEIVVAGQFFHTGTPVVLWVDPGGYDAYRVERRFSPLKEADWASSQKENKELVTPNRYDSRKGFSPDLMEKTRSGNWDLATLQQVVDQFVIHYDASGASRSCFRALHDGRDLSVHFLLDLDGTIYQTLDLKERAWHATISNSRSVGIEIANLGAYAQNERDSFDDWYQSDLFGRMLITIPPRIGSAPERTPSFVGRPVRNKIVFGELQGKPLRQYDFTPQQYAALVKLTAALCTVFPKITCDYPRDDAGRLMLQKLPNSSLTNYHGVLGHYHIQTDKVDPGPAFQWDYVIGGARQLMSAPKLERNSQGQINNGRPTLLTD